ncbi:hypothetical protein SLA2020_314640 [Shorea laevis]
MAYSFRARNYIVNPQELGSMTSDEEGNGYDSSLSDPDYVRPRRQRRVQRNPDRGAATSSVAAQAQGAETGSTNAVSGSSSSVNYNPVERRTWHPLQINDVEENSERSVQRRSSVPPRRGARELVTKKTLFSWLINMRVLHVNQKVLYLDMERNAILLEGSIRQGGILCKCCKEELTPWQFEAHACSGYQFRFWQPYCHIFLPRNQSSLLDRMVLAWHQPEEIARQTSYVFRPLENATDRSDDACIICADGGDLICCERCPSTFHLNCMGMEKLPQEEWLCPFCVCKYCKSGEGELLKCTHCVKKYHWDCFINQKGIDLNSTGSFSFCGSDCREVYVTLQEMLGVSNDVEGGISWTLLQRKVISQRLENDESIHKMEVNCKTAVAWGVLKEIFLTNIDRHTRIDVLQSVVYNRKSNLTRVNFGNFYVVVLEKKGEIIAAATIRVHGRSLAEMPFIGTREGHRNQGMSRKLLSSIESTLRSLKISNLVIPSMPELVNMWREKHLFSPIEDGLIKELRELNLLMFPSTVRLQKLLLSNRVAMEQEGNSGGLVLPDLNLVHLDLNFDPPEEMEE